MTFVVLRHTLSGIMGRMAHQFQKAHSPTHYHEIIALDDEILKFTQSLPPQYSLEPDTSLDQTLPFIPAHRFLLVTEILFVRITLHRPYLLRRLGSERYLRSRNACFDCALKDHRIRKAFSASSTKDVRDPIASAYREFQTAMISGIYLVLYPKGKDAESMRSICDTFIKEHDPISELDETTRREVRIIEFLRNKASPKGAEEQLASYASTQPSEKPHTDAQLLLGLHRASGRVPAMASRVASSPLAQGAVAAVTPSPSTPFGSGAEFPRSSNNGLSALQQLQQTESSSQSGSGSPVNEDESTAQSLLDQWCNVFSGGPALEGIPSGTALPWATPGISDLTGWFNGGTSPLLGSDPNPIPDVDGSDWSYWETLVNQIRSGPVA